MTIAELRRILDEYDDGQFVHVRVWLPAYTIRESYIDVTVDKVQSGVDGAALITVTAERLRA